MSGEVVWNTVVYRHGTLTTIERLAIMDKTPRATIQAVKAPGGYVLLAALVDKAARA